jgi:hypothetical protein
MDFVRKVVKFNHVWIIPLMFMIAIFLDPKYSIQEKQILSLCFCGLGRVFGYLYKLAENIDNNQQTTTR